MRCCDNCNFSSLGLDCNTGIETLYCGESNYEFETTLNDSCECHQFIDGLETEKNYLLYDESYFGPGYFIIHTEDGQITKFLKLYIMNQFGFPHYGLRAFSIDGKDKPDLEFNNIEFVFRSREDLDNGLFEAFSMVQNNKFYTIDPKQQGRNNVSISVKNGIIRLVCSKDVYKGKQHPSDFIDINLGDNFSCVNYETINNLFNSLSNICPPIVIQEDVLKLVLNKLNS